MDIEELSKIRQQAKPYATWEGHCTFVPAPLPPKLDYSLLRQAACKSNATMANEKGFKKDPKSLHFHSSITTPRSVDVFCKSEGTHTNIDELVLEEEGIAKIVAKTHAKLQTTELHFDAPLKN